eukprot:scaffold3901_cov390-Prasinococcus_capsulatus_cf.AAC.6
MRAHIVERRPSSLSGHSVRSSPPFDSRQDACAVHVGRACVLASTARGPSTACTGRHALWPAHRRAKGRTDRPTDSVTMIVMPAEHCA